MARDWRDVTAGEFGMNPPAAAPEPLFLLPDRFGTHDLFAFGTEEDEES